MTDDEDNTHRLTPALAEASRRLTQRLREAGFTVTQRKYGEQQPLTATFVPRKPRPPE